MIRSLAALLAAAMFWCAGPRLESGGATKTPSFQRLKVTDFFIAVLPTAAKTPLSSSQPRTTLPFFATPEGACAIFRSLVHRGSMQRGRASLLHRRTLVGTVELRI